MIRIKKYENGKREHWALQTRDGDSKFAIRWHFNMSRSVRRTPYAVELCRVRPVSAPQYYTASAFFRTGIPTHPHVLKAVSKDLQCAARDLLALCVGYADKGLSREDRRFYEQQHAKIVQLLTDRP